MNHDRIEEIMKATAYPESNSGYQALLQVWNEVQHDNNTRIGACEYCVHFDTSLGNSPRHGYCSRLRDTEQALWVNIETVADWYCRDFERKSND